MCDQPTTGGDEIRPARETAIGLSISRQVEEARRRKNDDGGGGSGTFDTSHATVCGLALRRTSMRNIEDCLALRRDLSARREVARRRYSTVRTRAKCIGIAYTLVSSSVVHLTRCGIFHFFRGATSLILDGATAAAAAAAAAGAKQ